MTDNLQLIYGKGTTKNIVATEIVPDKGNLMEVFYRNDDKVTSEYIKYEPYVYLNDEDSIMDKLYDDTKVMKLLGSNYYNRMIQSPNFGFIKWIEKEADHSDGPFSQSQWLVQSGETQYKGMGFDDPLRMYCDIEVITKEGYDMPNSSRPEDKICMIVMYTNKGDSTLIILDEDKWSESNSMQVDGVELDFVPSEKQLLHTFVDLVQRIDPDIIVGHYFFGFDLPYIRDRAQMLDVELKLGRNQSTPNTFTTSIKFAEKSDQYENFQIYGRHVLDTYFMAKQFDVVARTLDNYKLKDCVKHLGKASDDRTYIEGEDITEVWFNKHPKYDRKDLIRYAIDDGKETQILDREWGRNMFAQTRMIPLPMQDVFRYGSGNKIDLLFAREYYRYGWSWPKPEEQRDFSGGYAGTGRYGLVDQPLVYMDVGSMYPTLSEILKIQPKSDELKIYPEMIRLLKAERYKYKDLMKENRDKGNDELANRHDATQGGLKILLNTASFGYVGSRWGAFNDYDEAERITTNGRKITKMMLKQAENLGSTPVKWDTDGTLVTVPKDYQGCKDREIMFIKIVEHKVNQWIENGGLE